MNCLLCKSAETECTMVLSRDEVTRLYKKHFDLDVKRILGQDISVMRCASCDMLFYDPPQAGDESFYAELQKFPWYYESEKEEFLWAKDCIPEGSSILEVGAGRGAFAAHVRTSSYTGLDFNPSAKAAAAEQGIEIQAVPIETWADQNPERYDVVCHFQVLEHITEPREFLLACARALKPGGILLISVPAESSYMAFMVNDILNMPPHHATRWTDRALKAVAQVIGCKIEEISHDSISPAHGARLFAAALQKRWFGYDHMLDTTVSGRIKQKIVHAFIRLFGLAELDAWALGSGNTVKVMYRKPLAS